jgi:tyrosinase
MQFFLLASLVASQCQVRREWRQLSTTQQRNYLTAVQTLKDRPDGPEGEPAAWNQVQFAQAHIKYYAANHDKKAFFPWHRLFIQAYENALRSIDSSITLPYWDCKRVSLILRVNG